MKHLIALYRRSSWHPVYNFMTTGGKARSNLLFAIIAQAIVNGFTGGIFYTGLLVGYGINIVNISILAMIPYITSLLNIFVPYILERFPKRRILLSVCRALHYLVDIVGITLLPQLVHSESGRIIGLIIIIFVSRAINSLTVGYNAWHMPYVTSDIRNNYFTATTLVGNISSSLVLLIASSVLDAIPPENQLNLITTLRYVSFGIALLDVYLLQVPKEPTYFTSSSRPKIIDIFRRPLQDKQFRWTMLVLALYQLFTNIPTSVLNAWLLEEVKVSYLYITAVDATLFLFIIFTSRIWNRFLRKKGACKTIMAMLISEIIAVSAYAFVNPNNYLWLMTFVRFTQHFFSLAWNFGSNHIYYENLPPKDRTTHLSFHSLSVNSMVFLSMTLGTTSLSAMGEKTVTLFGQVLTSVPVLLLTKAVLLILLVVIVFLLRKRLETPRTDAIPSEKLLT